MNGVSSNADAEAVVEGGRDRQGSGALVSDTEVALLPEADELRSLAPFEVSEGYNLRHTWGRASQDAAVEDRFPSRRSRRLAVGAMFVSALLLLVGFLSLATDGRSAWSSAELKGPAGSEWRGDGGGQFELQREVFLAEFNFTARLFRHRSTGAQVFSISATDANKAAAVSFRTPVQDNKGKPHVLEHCLLGGSQKYPTHAPPPFDRMSEGSLYTYLNAETFADRTLFPVASTNLKDFHNLVDVYLDALFAPLFAREPRIFEQEAWHYALYDADHPEEVEVRGVVLSEMRGVLSDPAARLAQLITRSLFPDTTYKYESGGMPMDLTELSLTELNAYYQQMYHPGNACFWFYGDDDEAARLARVTAAIEDYADVLFDPDTSRIKPQPPFASPRKVKDKYPSRSDGDAYVVTSWALTTGTAGLPPEDRMGMTVLCDLLLDDDSAPLTAALLQLDLGADVLDDGLDMDTIQPTFTVGLQGVADISNAEAIHEAVLQTLEETARNGFSREAVAAALHRTEMDLRRAPAEDPNWGITLMNDLAGPWAWERDIFAALTWESELQALSTRLAESSSAEVFGPLIRKYLLENPHRVDVTLVGSKSLAAEEEAARAARLAEVAAGMEPGGEAARKMVAATLALSTWQEGPDPDSAIATIPQLNLADVSSAAQWTPSTIQNLYGCQLIRVEQPTSGLLYATLALELSESVKPSEVASLPLLAYALDELGYAGRSAAERAAHEGARTGGLEFSVHATQRDNEEGISFYLLIEGVAQVRNADVLLSAMGDALIRLDWDAPESEDLMRRHIFRALANLESDFEADTLQWASGHSAAMLTPAAWIRDQMEGLPQAKYLQDVITHMKAPGGWHGAKRDLTVLMSRIRYQFGTVIGLTGDASTLAAASGAANELLQRLQPLGASDDNSVTPPIRPRAAAWNITAESGNHALLTEEKNNHIASSARLRSPLPGCAFATAAILDNYLNLKIREERGAYGAYATLDSAAATFELSSYRDPGLDTTIATFTDVPRWLRHRSTSLNPRDLTNAVLGGVRDLEPHRSPAQAGRDAVLAKLNRVDVASRQSLKDGLLNCSADGIAEFAVALDAAPFFTTAAARESEAERVQRDDGLPFFDRFISLDNIFGSP